jgi:hypothetical protein
LSRLGRWRHSLPQRPVGESQQSAGLGDLSVEQPRRVDMGCRCHGVIAAANGTSVGSRSISMVTVGWSDSLRPSLSTRSASSTVVRCAQWWLRHTWSMSGLVDPQQRHLLGTPRPLTVSSSLKAAIPPSRPDTATPCHMHRLCFCSCMFTDGGRWCRRPTTFSAWK